MAYSAVKFLIEHLRDLLSNKENLIQDAETELVELVEVLDKLKPFIKLTSQHRETYDDLARRIEEAVYEVEEIIDSFISRAVLAKSRGVFSKHLGTKILGKMGVKRNGLATQVKDFREQKLNPLISEVPNLSAAEQSGRSTLGEEEETITPYKDIKLNDVVGLEDELETLIGYLHAEEEQFEVISITGAQGIGKTTMARRIFEDPRVQREFPTCVWINVSQELNMMHLLFKIMRALTKRNISNKTEDELAQLVPKYLEMGKFLLILNDVWTPEKWKQIQSVFPTNKTRKGKVLITTSDMEVAKSASTSKPPHVLRPLNEDESWELLKLQVFGGIRECPDHQGLVSGGKLIANNCHGFPLSIVLIGGILFKSFTQEVAGSRRSTKEIGKEWKMIAMNPVANIPLDKVPDQMEALIQLSYETLPHDLRDCFLYLGMFPADTEILASKLIQLWIAEGFICQKKRIAEGFICQKKRKSLDNIARDNLKELISRNLLMVYRIKVGGEVKACRVHHTIRDFCITEAGKGKHNLFLRPTSPHQPGSDFNYKNCRRLCIHSDVKRFLSGKPDVSKARSILCFSKSPIILNGEDTEYLGHTFNMVRVLEASNIQLHVLPKKITHLVHLRYLTLYCKEFNTLPEAISNLWYLQTLIVDTLSRRLEFKASMWKMMHLRYFKTKASVVLSKKFEKDDELDGGEELQILNRLSPQSFTDDVYKKAKNLRELGIRGTLSDTIDFEKLASLERLNLQHDVYPKKESENPLTSLPDAKKFPPKLSYLVLSCTYLVWERISPLAEISTLKVLHLKDNAFTGETWDVAEGGFKCLEALSIEEADLKYWTASDNSFPQLKTLDLEKCEKLQEVPLELGKTLEKLVMSHVTRYAISSAREIEQDRAAKGGFKVQIYNEDI